MQQPVAKMESNGAQKVATQKKRRPHIIIGTTGGIGHINPLLKLSTGFAEQGNLVTLISSELMISTLRSAGDEVLKGGTNGCSEKLDIRLVGVWDGYPVSERPTMSPDIIWQINARVGVGIGLYLEKLVSDLEEEAAEEQKKDSFPACVMVDNHLWNTAAVIDKLKIPRYVFFPTSIFYAAVMSISPHLVSQGLLELGPALSEKKDEEQLCIPGFPALPFGKFPNSSKERPEIFLNCGKAAVTAKGLIINTYDGLEFSALESLRANDHEINFPGSSGKFKMPPVYPVGPLFSSSFINRTVRPQDAAECTQFLDSKRPSSVIYVAFGTESVFFREQIQELAWGLEASQQAFLWVIRIHKHSSTEDLLARVDDLLPTGFRERIMDRGLVVPSLAPQLAVLSHPSTGAIFSHCGWNSVLESVYYGVPILAFPQVAEQHLCCRLIVHNLKIGVELPRTKSTPGQTKLLASKEDIESAVRILMTEGEVRSRILREISKLRSSARVAATTTAPENLSSFLKAVHAASPPPSDSRKNNHPDR